MPAWNEARRMRKESLAGALADRAAGGQSRSILPRAAERWEKQICIYCGHKVGARVGRLAISGPVVFCRQHAGQYQKDKDWEARHKSELGL